jgi:DNA-directed RNA polymerase subunit RPC12/RpoP
MAERSDDIRCPACGGVAKSCWKYGEKPNDVLKWTGDWMCIECGIMLKPVNPEYW